MLAAPSTLDATAASRARAKCPKCAKTWPPGRPPRNWDCPTCGVKTWQPDDSVDACQVCRALVAKFTRHHCRKCGLVTCTACTQLSIFIPEWSVTDRQRVCRRCAVPDADVTMRGMLNKLGQRHAFFKEKFQPRYFELRGNVLIYGKERAAVAAATAGAGGSAFNDDANAAAGAPATTSSGGGGAPLTSPTLGNSSNVGASASAAAAAPPTTTTPHSTTSSGGGGAAPPPPPPASSSSSGTASSLSGQIDLTNAKLIDVAIHPHAFCLIGPLLQRGYVLSAESAERKHQWVAAIQAAIAAHAAAMHAAAAAAQGLDPNSPAGGLLLGGSGGGGAGDDDARTEAVLFGGDESQPPVSMADFDLLTVLGLGSFGRVMKVRQRRTGAIFAMKVLDKQQIVANRMVVHTQAEKAILTEVQHPFVVKLHYAFQTKRHLVLVLDFLCGGELFFHLQRNKKFSEARARFYAAEIGLALEHIHSMNIIYRDLKPENLVLDRHGHVVLTDFGLAKREVRDATHTFCGTPEYMAPELIQKKGHDTAVDWWSLGIFIFEMVHGLPPFYTQNIPEMYDLILHKPLVFPGAFSRELKSLLARLLERDPAKRLRTGEEFRRHPFFADMDFQRLHRRELRPEFVPDVSGNDLRYFDKQFTQESTKVPQLDQPVDPNDPVASRFKDFEYSSPLVAVAPGSGSGQPTMTAATSPPAPPPAARDDLL